MSIDKKFDLLSRIDKVEAPPFLLTRIREKINQLNAPVPTKWKVAFAVIVMIVLSINISILGRIKGYENKAEQIVSSMRLSSSNDIYNDKN